MDLHRDPEVDRLERERLWPRVWQMACRETELRTPGDFVVYDIVDDSILIVRTGPGADDVAAMYNACQLPRHADEAVAAERRVAGHGAQRTSSRWTRRGAPASQRADTAGEEDGSCMHRSRRSTRDCSDC